MSVSPDSMTIGHVGLLVRDLDGMAKFYTDVLGFVLTDKGERIRFLSRDPRQHHQVVLAPGRPADAPEMINQLSFKVGTLDEVKAIHARLVAAGIGPLDPLTHGNAWSVYFRDPENNRLEFYCDTPWHIPQPFRRPIDFTKSVDEIYAHTKAICEAEKGYMPMPEYEKKLATRIEPAPVG